MTTNNYVNPKTVYGAVLGYENGSMPASIKKHRLVVKNANGQVVERHAMRGRPTINTVLAIGEAGELEQLADSTNATVFCSGRLNSDGTGSGRGYFATLAREQLDPKGTVIDYWMNRRA